MPLQGYSYTGNRRRDGSIDLGSLLKLIVGGSNAGGSAISQIPSGKAGYINSKTITDPRSGATTNIETPQYVAAKPFADFISGGSRAAQANSLNSQAIANSRALENELRGLMFADRLKEESANQALINKDLAGMRARDESINNIAGVNQFNPETAVRGNWRAPKDLFSSDQIEGDILSTSHPLAQAQARYDFYRSEVERGRALSETDYNRTVSARAERPGISESITTGQRAGISKNLADIAGNRLAEERSRIGLNIPRLEEEAALGQQDLRNKVIQSGLIRLGETTVGSFDPARPIESRFLSKPATTIVTPESFVINPEGGFTKKGESREVVPGPITSFKTPEEIISAINKARTGQSAQPSPDTEQRSKVLETGQNIDQGKVQQAIQLYNSGNQVGFTNFFQTLDELEKSYVVQLLSGGVR